MKLLKMLFVLSVVLLVASSSFATCTHKPKDGVYTTSGGTLFAGRASEAFCGGVGPGAPGNTQNAMSWDGAALGGQWHIWGMAIDATGAVETGRFFDAHGNGWIDYVTDYTGGQFWLSGGGAWTDGLGDFGGTITYYNVDAKVSYIGGQPVGVTSNISMRGAFASCNYCFIDYGISNVILVWRTGYTAPMPANYPPFLCSANAGELYDVCDATISIFCDVTATQPSTWGQIKDLYR
jgi:hypothetical protein